MIVGQNRDTFAARGHYRLRITAACVTTLYGDRYKSQFWARRWCRVGSVLKGPLKRLQPGRDLVSQLSDLRNSTYALIAYQLEPNFEQGADLSLRRIANLSSDTAAHRTVV